MNSKSHIKDEKLQQFADSCSEYCLLLEHAANFPRSKFVEKLRRLLPFVYAYMAETSKHFQKEEYFSEKVVGPAEWQAVHERVLKLLANIDSYNELTDVEAGTQETPLTRSIAEDLTDVYQDVKDFVTLFNTGTSETAAEAFVSCYVAFDEFWGAKLLAALKAIHLIYTGPFDLEAEDEKPNELINEDELPDTDDWIISKRINDLQAEE